MNLPALWARIDREGSTRAAGLMRIGTGLALWSRWAQEMTPYRELDPDRLLLAVAFYIAIFLLVAGA